MSPPAAEALEEEREAQRLAVGDSLAVKYVFKLIISIVFGYKTRCTIAQLKNILVFTCFYQ